MRIDILTVVPELLASPLNESILKRAQEKGLVEIHIHNIRDYTEDKHRTTDDYPFGGEAGMVMKIEPIYRCIEALKAEREYDEVIYTSPDGIRYDQHEANRLSTLDNLIILCGHYKGIDYRIREHLVTREISIGDYVLTGGELAACIIADSVIRIIPGAIGDEASALTDCFQDNLLAPPVYTRPAEFNGWKVPDVLLSGNFARIDRWKEEQAWERQAQTQRLIDVLMLVIPLLVSVACLIVAIILFLRYGREHKPSFDGEYWRDVPEKGTNPAVIARLIRWNKPDANDLTAVLMHLSNLGVVSISRESTIEERKILGDKERTVYRLGINPEKRATVELDSIDAKALDLVFDKIGVQYGSVTLDDIEAYAKDHAQSYVNSMELWQGTIGAEVDRRGFFEKAGESCKRAFQVAAAVLVVIGVGVGIIAENFMPLIGLVPGAIILLVFAHFMPRRSVEAVEIQARCDALKRWFKDLSLIHI